MYMTNKLGQRSLRFVPTLCSLGAWNWLFQHTLLQSCRLSDLGHPLYPVSRQWGGSSFKTSKITPSPRAPPILLASPRSSGARHPLNLRLVPHPLFSPHLYYVHLHGSKLWYASPCGVLSVRYLVWAGSMGRIRGCKCVLVLAVGGPWLLVLCHLLGGGRSASRARCRYVERCCGDVFSVGRYSLVPRSYHRRRFVITAEVPDSDRQT